MLLYRYLFVFLVAVPLLASCGPQFPAPETDEPLAITGPLAGEAAAEGYARVTGSRPFRFPADHGPHPEYRHEWWYVTGNVTTESGRRFGYQITFFRFNVAPEMGKRASNLASNQVWMAHFGLTDPESGRFLHSERFARGGKAGLAGATAEPFRVWLEDWSLSGHGNSDIMPLQLTVADTETDVTVNLQLEARKPLVLQGDAGYSRKGSDRANASHYYSYTRLVTNGELIVNGERHDVRGESWMDREWGTSALSEDQEGWDWFALQLSDDRDIMFYQLRQVGGGQDPRSKGLLVQRDGSYRVLAVDEVELRPTRYWTSRESGVTYPVSWRLTIPGESLELQIGSIQENQELQTGFRYWEGAVDVSGSADGEPVTGRGYLEMTGYTQ